MRLYECNVVSKFYVNSSITSWILRTKMYGCRIFMYLDKDSDQATFSFSKRSEGISVRSIHTQTGQSTKKWTTVENYPGVMPLARYIMWFIWITVNVAPRDQRSDRKKLRNRSLKEKKTVCSTTFSTILTGLKILKLKFGFR